MKASVFLTTLGCRLNQAESASFAGAFLLAFLMIMIALTVIGNIPNISFKIPNLDGLNDIGGAVTGVVLGACLLLVFGWALKFTGLLIGNDTLASTRIGGWLLHKDFLLKYMGI